MRRVLIVVTAVLAGFAGLVASSAPAEEVEMMAVIHPSVPVDESGVVVVEDGGMVTFSVFSCPRGTDGFPVLGADGVPGTDDDDCVEKVASWQLFAPLGTIEPNPAHETVLTAQLPPGATVVTGTIGAFYSGDSATIPVRVIEGQTPPPPPTQPRLAFLDGFEDETQELTQFRAGAVRSLFLCALTSRIARREARGGQATRGQLRLLEQLVGTDHRHRVVGRDLPPGVGDGPVVATVRTFLANGEVADEVDVVLEPDGGELRMQQQLVFIAPESREPVNPPGFRGLGSRVCTVPQEADGLVFLTAFEPGTAVAQAPGFTDATGTIRLPGAPDEDQ